MRQEIESLPELAALSKQWMADDDDGASRIIQRIEDIPSLEDISTGGIEWVVDGIFAQGALHMITSESGAGKSTFMSAVAEAVSRGKEFMGRATSKRKVLLLDAENPIPAVRERFARLGIETHPDFLIWGQWVGEDPPVDGRHVVTPPAEPFMTARGWMPGFRRDAAAARSWLSKRWAELNLPSLPRGPKK